LSIVHISIKLQRFRSWVFFRLQVKKEDLGLAKPGFPSAEVFSFLFYLKTEEDAASETL
jgi:hypothetical protein